jgi:hypothetical protein
MAPSYQACRYCYLYLKPRDRILRVLLSLRLLLSGLYEIKELHKKLYVLV